MPRIKIVHKKNFTIIHNECIKKLQPFELGVLIKMLEKKDDYYFSIDRFAKEIGETRQKTSKAINVLEDSGYLYRKQSSNNTKFGRMIYYLSDIPCLKNGIDDIDIEIEKYQENCETENRTTQNSITANAVTDNCMTETQSTLLSTNKARTNKTRTKEINKEKPKTSKPDKQKKQFAEAVYMTETEYQTLCEKHSKEFADRCIEVLNNYKLSKGKFYRSDYHAILAWVEKKVSEDLAKESPKQIETVAVKTDPNENPFTKFLNESGGA